MGHIDQAGWRAPAVIDAKNDFGVLLYEVFT